LPALGPEETETFKELQFGIFRMNCEALYTNQNLALKLHVREEGRKGEDNPNPVDGVIKTEHWLFDIEKSRLVCWL
jgi:hypothetical protein